MEDTELRDWLQEIIRETIEEVFGELFGSVEDPEDPAPVWGTYNALGGCEYLPVTRWKDENPEYSEYFDLLPNYWITVEKDPEQTPPIIWDDADQLRRNRQHWRNMGFLKHSFDTDSDGIPNWLEVETAVPTRELGLQWPIVDAQQFNSRFSGDFQKETRTGTIGAHENPLYTGEKFSETSKGTPYWTLIVRNKDSIVPICEEFCRAMKERQHLIW